MAPEKESTPTPTAMPISSTATAEQSTTGFVTGWRSFVGVVCMFGVLLPTLGLVPLGFLLQSRLQTEEEAKTVNESEIEATAERRRPPSPPHTSCLPEGRHSSDRIDRRDRNPGDRSEHRLQNGTGAPLRC